jgi:hypothetical protein
MRGVCGDAMNLANRPSPDQLRALGADGVRIVYFPTPEFDAYYRELVGAGLAVAVVLTGESFPDDRYDVHAAAAAAQLSHYPDPALWLLGNEPSASRDAASSWAMSPPQYAAFWQAVAPAIKAILPGALCYVGGMLGPAEATWLDSVWAQLQPWPDGIDVHYPNTESELRSWERYQVPLAVMEWAWAGADVAQADVVQWQAMLTRHTGHSCWFCWGWSPDLCLVSPETGEPLKAYHDYAAALSG